MRINRSKTDPETIVGKRHDEASCRLIIDAVDPIDDPFLARSVLLLSPCSFQQAEERQRCAVGDRRFFRIEFNKGIVNRQRMKRAHQMLDGTDFKAARADCRRAKRRCDVFCSCRNQSACLIHPTKDDAGFRRRRLYGEMHFAARVQPNARIGDLACECHLFLQIPTSTALGNFYRYFSYFCTSTATTVAGGNIRTLHFI